MKSKIKNHPRIDYKKTLISLWRTLKGASLKYEDTKSSGWKDLVLRDRYGKEIARMMTYGTFGNNDLRYSR